MIAEPLSSAFLLELIVNTSHKAVVQNFCTKLEQHLATGDALKVALGKVKPIFNSAKLEQQLAIRNEVVKVIAKYKKVKPITLEAGAYKGSLGFSRHGTEEENQARVMLQYYFPLTQKKPKASSEQQVVKQVDEVEALLAKLYAMPRKEQDRFHKLYLNDRRK